MDIRFDDTSPTFLSFVIDTGGSDDQIVMAGIDIVAPVRINGGRGFDSLLFSFESTVDQQRIEDVETLGFLD